MSAIRIRSLFRAQTPSLFGGALLMLFIVWMGRDSPAALAGAYLVACCVLGASMYGTETTLGFVAQLLVQPIPRRDVWRERHLVTALLMLPLAGLFALLLTRTTVNHPEDVWFVSSPVFTLLAPLFAITTGPLLTLILGRAMIALIAMLSLVGFSFLGALQLSWLAGAPTSAGQFHACMILLALTAAFASLAGARRYLNLEDYSPLQKTLEFGDFTGWIGRRKSRRCPRPWIALLQKECALQINSFILIAAILFLGWVISDERDPKAPLAMMMLMVAAVQPVLFGLVAVAEEHRTQGWEQTFAAPVSRWFTASVKLLTAYALALITAAILYAIYHLLEMREFGAQLGRLTLHYWIRCPAGVLAGALAAALGRNYPQAIANLALMWAIGWAFQWAGEYRRHELFVPQWRGSIVDYWTMPIAGIWLVSLTYWNLTRIRSIRRRYLTALVTAAVASAVIPLITIIVTDRTWERVTLPRALQEEIYPGQDLAPFFNQLMQQLVGVSPAGRLWELVPPPDTGELHAPRAKLLSAETNWLNVAGASLGFAAVKRDGTLWMKRGPQGRFDDFVSRYRKEHRAKYEALFQPELTRIGAATNWTKVSGGWLNFVGLRGDGTLWTWGGGARTRKGETNRPPFRPSPTQLGKATHWIDIISHNNISHYALSEDGRIFEWGQCYEPNDKGGHDRVQITEPRPSMFFEETKVEGFVETPSRPHLTVRTKEKTLQYRENFPYKDRPFPVDEASGHYSIPREFNVAACLPHGNTCHTIDRKGRLMFSRFASLSLLWTEFIPLSSSTNWVAIADYRGGTRRNWHLVAVQRDGSLWSMFDPTPGEYRMIPIPPRYRPKRIGFILRAEDIP